MPSMLSDNIAIIRVNRLCNVKENENITSVRAKGNFVWQSKTYITDNTSVRATETISMRATETNSVRATETNSFRATETNSFRATETSVSEQQRQSVSKQK